MEWRALIGYLKLGHGAFNLLVFLLIVLQAWHGIKIRKRRRAGAPPDWSLIRSHRKRGPLLVIFILIGYAAGLSLAFADHGRIFKYPLHFVTGSVLALSLVTTYAISRKIRSNESAWRTPHFVLGILILCLYVVQMLFGLAILL